MNDGVFDETEHGAYQDESAWREAVSAPLNTFVTAGGSGWCAAQENCAQDARGAGARARRTPPLATYPSEIQPHAGTCGGSPPASLRSPCSSGMTNVRHSITRVTSDTSRHRARQRLQRMHVTLR